MLRAEKKEQEENEKRLVAAGEIIRDMALKCSGGGAESKGEGGSARKQRCLQQEGTLSDEYFTSSILSQAENFRESEKKRSDL